MNQRKTLRTTGILLILGAVLVNVPYALLIATFNYPDILREPPEHILTRFAAGGPGLIWTWLLFAWIGLPILLGVLMLPQAIPGSTTQSRGRLSGRMALFFGAAGLVLQMIGLLRWPFVVPVLARLYTNPDATTATRAAVSTVFLAVHHYGGVVLGEHLGQAFTILWMILLSASLLAQGKHPRWLSWLGFGAAAVYLLAQGELLETVLPGFPVWGTAGLLGSLLWLVWIAALGIVLLHKSADISHDD